MKIRVLKYITVKRGDNTRAVLFPEMFSHKEVASGFGKSVVGAGLCEIIFDEVPEEGPVVTVNVRKETAVSLGISPSAADADAILRSVTNGPHDYWLDSELKK